MNPILIFLGIIALWFIWATIFGNSSSTEERNSLAPPPKKPNYNPKDFGFNPARGYSQNTLKFMEERNGVSPAPFEFPPISSKTKNKEITEDDLTPEMKDALTAINQGRNIFVQGSAGTGKSTFIRYIEKYFTTNGYVIALTAPTGIAAQNINGCTIHSFFRFGKDSGLLTYKKLHPEGKIGKWENLLFQQTDLIIIDEISMVRADVFDCLCETLKKHANGFQLCVIGDMKQLPPIVNKEISSTVFKGKIYDSPYFTASRHFEELQFEKHYFTHNFRQDEKKFMEVLKQLRNGYSDETILDYLNQRTIQKTGNPKHPLLTLCTTNDVADDINNNKLAGLTNTNKLWKYDAQYNLNDFYGKTLAEKKENLQKKLNTKTRPEQQLKLAEGARVMFTTNSSSWVNGTMGIVESLDDTTVYVKIDDRETVSVTRKDYDTYSYDIDNKTRRITKRTTTYRQFPLMLAWAVTIHKAQGLSLNNVQINFKDGTFAKEQFYVAVSRCHTYDGLYFDSEISSDDIKGRSLHTKRQQKNYNA